MLRLPRALRRHSSPLTAAALLCTALALGAPGANAATSTPVPDIGAQAAELARANLDTGACGTNSNGGTGYGSSCTGNAGQPEPWCADFAAWIWARAGATTLDLTPAAGSFAVHGPLQTVPHVGDAVVFNYDGYGSARHVALVTEVHPDGTITTIGGNEEGETGNWSATSRVHQTGPYNAAVGSDATGQTVSGYVSPF